MAGSVGSTGIILLLENYSWKSRQLYEALRKSCCSVVAVVLEENDFLPENVFSIYDLISGSFKDGKIEKTGKPKYFNEIAVPEEWSLRAGDEKEGSIVYQQVKKGRIQYTDSVKKRLVQTVDWYDRTGVVRFRNHYNRYGNISAGTVCDAKGQPVSKSWFSPEGREIMMENYITRDIILNDGNRIRFFRSKEELMLYCLKTLGFDRYRIFFNSLSMPFLLSNRLGGTAREDVLFWQEMAKDAIPWNMRLILEGRALRCDNIIVQGRREYDQLLELGVQESRIRRLGFLYPFEKENRHRPKALICTNSDRIEHVEELIKMLPQMHFHIAALTWMSQKLFALEQYDNVSLYPGAEMPVLDELFAKCDYYFDINHRAEIINAVYRAFLNNQLIFAFQETVHNREFVADMHIYPAAEFERMAADVKETMLTEAVMESELEKQRKYALAEDKETYRKLLKIQEGSNNA